MSASNTLNALISTGRNCALELVNDIAGYCDMPAFQAQPDAKAWAQGARYDEIAPALTIYGADVAYALSRLAKGEAVTYGADSLKKLILRTFPAIGKVSIRHDSRKTEPEPSKGIDPDTFEAREHAGIWGCFGFAPKTVKAKAHITDDVIRTDVEHADMQPVPDSAPIPEGTARNDRGDVLYTHEGTKLAAAQAAATAVREFVTNGPEGRRVLAQQARLSRVVRVAKSQRAELAKVRAELENLRAELAKVQASKVQTSKPAPKARKARA